MSIQDRLNSYLEIKNLSLNRLSDLSGVTQSTLHNFMSGKGSLRLDTLYKVCVGLGISVLEFLDFPPYNVVDDSVYQREPIALPAVSSNIDFSAIEDKVLASSSDLSVSTVKAISLYLQEVLKSDN